MEDFLSVHRDYAHEPEPYEWLEVYGEAFAAEPDAGSFYRQLEVSVDRLTNYAVGSRVIAERSPLDFLAYLLAQNDLGRSARDCELIATAAELAAAGIGHLDLLVVLPLNDVDRIVAPLSEDLELRESMNDCLMEIVSTDPYALLTQMKPRVVEIHGTPRQRFLELERIVAEVD